MQAWRQQDALTRLRLLQALTAWSANLTADVAAVLLPECAELARAAHTAATSAAQTPDRRSTLFVRPRDGPWRMAARAELRAGTLAVLRLARALVAATSELPADVAATVTSVLLGDRQSAETPPPPAAVADAWLGMLEDDDQDLLCLLGLWIELAPAAAAAAAPDGRTLPAPAVVFARLVRRWRGDPEPFVDICVLGDADALATLLACVARPRHSRGRCVPSPAHLVRAVGPWRRNSYAKLFGQPDAPGVSNLTPGASQEKRIASRARANLPRTASRVWSNVADERDRVAACCRDLATALDRAQQQDAVPYNVQPLVRRLRAAHAALTAAVV